MLTIILNKKLFTILLFGVEMLNEQQEMEAIDTIKRRSFIFSASTPVPVIAAVLPMVNLFIRMGDYVIALTECSSHFR